MKKLLIIVSIFGFSLLWHQSALAQAGQIKLGAGLLYGTEVEGIGIQGNGLYEITPEIDIAASVNIFFPGESDTDPDSWWSVNGDVHYNVYSSDQLSKLYGLAGLNITTISVDTPFGSADEGEIGLNLGVGASFDVNFGSIFGEIKYVISDFDQLVVGAGVRFPLN